MSDNETAEVDVLERSSRSDADDRFAEADDDEQAVALGEVRHRHGLQSSKALACQPRRSGVVDRDRDQPQDDARLVVRERPRQQETHSRGGRKREPDDRRPCGVAAARSLGVEPEVDEAHDRVRHGEDDCLVADVERVIAAEGVRQSERSDEDRNQRGHQSDAEGEAAGVERVRDPNERRPRPPDQREQDRALADGRPAQPLRHE
jgi:hypothetical protein